MFIISNPVKQPQKKSAVIFVLDDRIYVQFSGFDIRRIFITILFTAVYKIISPNCLSKIDNIFRFQFIMVPNFYCRLLTTKEKTTVDTLIISLKDIQKIIHKVGLDVLMDETIIQLRKAFQEFDQQKTTIPPRQGFSYENPHMGLIEWMPLLHQQDRVVIKVVGYHPENPNIRQLPTILSTVSAYDASTGHLIGLMDGTFLTALRTGAASAIASEVMAKPESKILGLIGCGAQAVTQLHALSRIFDLQQVLVYDIDPTVSSSYQARVACLNLQGVEIKVSSLNELLANADIICTATSVDIGNGPVFTDRELKPWVHINAVGSDFPEKTELPLSLLKRSFVCPDFRQQAIKEGECQQLNSEDIQPELYQLIQTQKLYDHIRNQTTVFDSTGWALEDQVAMNLFLNYAREMKLGTLVQLESISADVHNPYDFSNVSENSIPETFLSLIS